MGQNALGGQDLNSQSECSWWGEVPGGDAANGAAPKAAIHSTPSCARGFQAPVFCCYYSLAGELY